MRGSDRCCGYGAKAASIMDRDWSSRERKLSAEQKKGAAVLFGTGASAQGKCTDDVSKKPRGGSQAGTGPRGRVRGSVSAKHDEGSVKHADKRGLDPKEETEWVL